MSYLSKDTHFSQKLFAATNALQAQGPEIKQDQQWIAIFTFLFGHSLIFKAK